MSRRVLVTGAAGFLGRPCLPRLAAAGFEVHAVSSRTRRPGELGVDHWHRLSLLDAGESRRALQAVRPSHLLHLAWITTPGVYWSSAENRPWLASSRALFEAFFAAGGERALGAGTCAEYDWSGAGYYDEQTSRLDPASLYGQCKAAAWAACQDAAARAGAQAAWARLFYPYGPGEPPQRLVSSLVLNLLEGRTADCTSGRQLRDFIYVDDAADALVTLLASSAGGAFNVGSGVPTLVRDVANLVGAAIGRPELVNPGGLPDRPGDPDCIVARIERLTGLGWRARVPLRQGIDETIAFYTRRK